MKKLALFLFLFLFWATICCAQFNGVKPPLGSQIQHYPQGLVLDLPLNENGGNRINDLSGNGHTGTITGATWASGKFGPCLNFDGDGDYVTTSLFRSVSAFTIVIWAKRNTIAGTYATLFGGLSNYKNTIAVHEDGDVTIGDLNAADYYERTTDARWTDKSTFHQIVLVATATSDVANNPAYLYFDGVLWEYFPNTVLCSTSFNSSKLGETVTTTGNSWNGQISSTEIYDHALTAAEVRELCYNPFGRFEEERPELYYTAAAPPAEDFQVIIVKAIEAGAEAAPFVIPLGVGVIGVVPWWMRRERRKAA